MTTFPASLPWHFGDNAPPAALRTLAGTALAWIADHGADGASLLLAQFRTKPRLVGVLRALLAGVQDLDDGAWQVLTERSLETSLGVQLDALGQLVGLARAGWTDEVYRAALRTQILVLRSEGRWSDTFAILRALDVPLVSVAVDEPGVATMRVVLSVPLLGEVTPRAVFGFLNRAHPAGVRFFFEFPTSVTNAAFTWADADDEQPDEARGWADDSGTLGGLWADALASTEND